MSFLNMDSCNLVPMEAELSPGSMEQWLSTVKGGNKCNKGKRSDLSIKVKKHLSALGWVFSYSLKGKRRELRYKSPKGRFFYSLAQACMSCLDEASHQQQQQQIVPKYDLSCSPRHLSSESSFDVSNQKQNQEKKRCRVEDFDTNGTAPEKENHSFDDLIKIVPNFGESNQEQKKKIENGVEDSDTAAVNVDQDKIRIVLNVDVLHQQKKRRKTASQEIKRPRIGKTPNNILQVMEKKQQKNKREKESLRFCRKDSGPDMNCDVCCVCHWGGELLLCDGCPSAFHHTCLGLSTLPEEDLWFCPCCCCDICGLMDSPENSKLMACEQCQRRFHLKCLKEEPCIVSSRGWFCSSQCNRVFSALQNLLGCKIAVSDDGDLVWTLMRAPNEDEHYDDEQKSKLESAVEILHQGFEPTEDLFSGRDLVEELIFKRDGNGVGRGFYTVLIERKNEPVTVAAMRVDKDVAEIPLVATLSNYRRSGMCRVLMDELEKQMSQMGVCRLVLPAAQEVVTTWTQRFGFSVMESSERLELVKHGMLDFVGTVMCHKFLLKEEREEDDSEEDDSEEESGLTE